MNINKKRAIAAAVSGVVTVLLAWVAGYDFDSRGANSFSVAIFTLMTSIFAATFPFSEDK